jgi:hypothetical protein
MMTDLSATRHVTPNDFVAGSQIARRFDVIPQIIWNLVNLRKIPTVRVGGRRMFYRDVWEGVEPQLIAEGRLPPPVLSLDEAQWEPK